MSGIDEVNDLANPEKWTGSGTDDDPVVPRGYAQRQAGGDAEAKPAVNEIAAANAMRAEDPEPVDSEAGSAATNGDLAADPTTPDEPSVDDVSDPLAATEPVQRNGDGPQPADGESGDDRP